MAKITIAIAVDVHIIGLGPNGGGIVGETITIFVHIIWIADLNLSWINGLVSVMSTVVGDSHRGNSPSQYTHRCWSELGHNRHRPHHNKSRYRTTPLVIGVAIAVVVFGGTAIFEFTGIDIDIGVIAVGVGEPDTVLQRCTNRLNRQSEYHRPSS